MLPPTIETSAWRVRETALAPDALGHTESVFALANGYLGIRGTLDEVRPSASRGTFLSGVYEHHPLSYPEDGYGHPHHGQAIIGVADGTGVHLQVDGVPFDVRETPPSHHERSLDLREGTLHRQAEWTTPRGGRMRLTSTRLVSLAQRSVTAIRYEVQAVDQPAQVVIRSDLIVNGTPPQVDNGDPRVGEALERPFQAGLSHCDDTGGFLVHRTRQSGIGVAAAVDHALELPEGGVVSTQCDDDEVVTTVVAELAPGQSVGLVKVLCHLWAPQDPVEDLREQVLAAMAGARSRGWAGLLTDQRSVLDQFWDDADVQVDGDPQLQAALRYDLFQLLQATACLDRAPVGAKGLTGPGTADTPSGTSTVSSYRPWSCCAPMTQPGCCSGAPRRWASPGSGPSCSGWPGPPSPGAPSTGRKSRHTGRPAPPPCTSMPTSPGPSPSGPRPRGRTSRGSAGSRCSWRRPGCGRPRHIRTTTVTTTCSG